jgi:hypothetical protein
VVMRHEMQQLAVEAEERPEASAAEIYALATIVSKTGWISVCDRLITRNISLVAVCCSSDSVT